MFAKLFVGLTLLVSTSLSHAVLLTVLPHPDEVDTSASLDLPTDAYWSNPAPAILSGHIGGVSRSPFDGSGASPDYGDANAISHWSIGTHALNNTSSSWLNFASDQSSLGLIWGSPDHYNYLELYNDNTLVAAFSGSDIIAQGGQRAVSLALVTISGLVFDQVKFRSTANAFEFSNITAQAVPGPGTLSLMMGALGLLALRQRSASSKR